MILSVLTSVSLFAATPTVDPFEDAVAARDRAIDARWSAVADRKTFDAECAAFRESMRKATGYHGFVRTPVSAKTYGTKDYGAFRIEKAVMESVPGCYVPLLVFLPDGKKFAPPYAGFVFIPGHSLNGKGGLPYLHTCELAARNGLAVVTYDPLGQGERSQGAGLRSADEHVRIGAYAALLGETTADYMLRDAVRVLDYFGSRPDIDPSRLGASGNSGGGTISAFLTVIDGRIKASVPSCYISSVREHVKANGPQDSEQNLFGGWKWGFNHVSLLFGGGCPVLINAAVDDFFKIEGTRSTFGIVGKVAAKVGLPKDMYELSEAPGRHAMSKVHREQAVRFFLKHLLGRNVKVAETETTDFKEPDYTVVPGGEVSRLPGFRSVYDELADKFTARGVSVDQAAENAKPLVLKELRGSGCKGVLATLKGVAEKGRRATLRIGGKPREGEVSAVFTAEGSRLVQKKKRSGKISYYERRKTDEVVAVDLYLDGRSLAALRAAELLTLAAELGRRTGFKPSLVAEGRFVTVAGFALAADPAAFADVKFLRKPKPFLEALKSRDYLSMADSGALCSARPDAAAGEKAKAGSVFDVRSYGAKGDGSVKDTAAIQRAVDAAAAAGGGKVLFGAGTYLSGTVFMKSGVTLEFAAGAVLKGSPDAADYCKADAFPQNFASTYDNMSGGHLIVAAGCRDIALRGPGRVDGNSAAFLLDKDGRQYRGWKKGIPWRPGQMIMIVDCTGVTVENLEMVNSPYWTCFLLNNRNVTVSGCRVRTERRKYRTWNGDGIDIDRCQNVLVTGCDINTEDDCITLRASAASRLANPQDCCGVKVRNCRLSSACNAVRIGVGEGVVRDNSLSGLEIYDSRNAVNIVSAYTSNSRGTDIHGITLSDIDARCDRFLCLAYGRKPGHAMKAVIRDIAFENVKAETKLPNMISEEPGRPFRNVVFRNCEIKTVPPKK